MLASKTRWNIQQVNEQQVQMIAQALHITPLVASLLVSRGYHTVEAARSFFERKQSFHSPFLLNDMEKAVERIEKAITNDEHILVFGDYDADGVSSTVVMVSALREKGANVSFYIPNRFTEGYGPNEQAFRLAKQQGDRKSVV